jgi:hypothetical protein
MAISVMSLKIFNHEKVGAVEKVNFLCDTPKSPRGDLLKSSDLESPPWGVWGIAVNLRSLIMDYMEDQ